MPSSTTSDSLPSTKSLQTALSHSLFDSTGNKTTLSAILDNPSPPQQAQTSSPTSPNLSQRSTPSTPTTLKSTSSALTGNTKTNNTDTTTDPRTSQPPQVLVIFIRNFLCGLCQQYISALSTLLPPSSLPANLRIVIIGCGASSLLPSYVEITQCPYEIYTDPSAELYRVLGMKRTLNAGSHSPKYIKNGLMVSGVRSIVQGMRRVGRGKMDILGGAGEMSVVGGEFLLQRDKSVSSKGLENVMVQACSEWKSQWCHRMRNTRDHTEIDDLKVVLGMAPPPPHADLQKHDADVGSRRQDVEDEDVVPVLRRSTTSKVQRTLSLSKRIQALGLGRSHTFRSGRGLGETKYTEVVTSSVTVRVVKAS